MSEYLAKGIDISHHQGTVNFATVKAAGFSFAIIKAGGADAGYYKDVNFETYYKNAVASGMHVGAYYFTGKAFYTKDQGKLEAEKFISLIKGKTFDYPVAVDIEAVPTSVGKTKITDAAIAFCETMEKAGYYTVIYASDSSGFMSRLDQTRLTAYDKWVARYASSGPKCVSKYGMWQYGGGVNYITETKVPGVSSAACDQDYAYIDYPAVIKKAGLNGYKAAEAETPVAPVTPEAKPSNGAESFDSRYKNGKRYTTTDNVNLRTGAGTNYKRIKVIGKGDTVVWYGYYTKAANGTVWRYVLTAGGAVGFMCGDYLK